MKKLFIFLFINSLWSNAQDLSVKEIMQGDDFVGTLPSNINWSPTNQYINFQWTDEGLFGYNLDKKEIESIDDVKIPQLNDNFSKSRNLFYFIDEGDLYSYTKSENRTIPIFKTSERLSEVQHVTDSTACFFRKSGNLYKYQGETGSLIQFTHFKEKKSPKAKAESFQERQNRGLFEHLSSSPKEKESKDPFTIYLADKKVDFMAISPTEKHLLYRTSKRIEYEQTKYFDYNTADGNATEATARAKVGKQKRMYELVLFLPDFDSLQVLDFSFLSGIRNRPAYQIEYGKTGALTEDKELIIHKPVYSNSGKEALISVKSQDNKDRWIVLLDCESGELTEIEHQQDEAWIGGPGIYSWNSAKGTLGWLNDDSAIYFQSEETGYSHLYLYTIKSKKKEALTKGTYEVHDCQLSKDGTTFFIQANKTHPGDRNFYHLDWKKKKLIPIITKTGNASVTVSPNEKHLAIRFSTATQPWELYLTENKPDAAWTQITHSTTEVFQSYQWKRPEVIRFKARDGKDVYARLYEPEQGHKNNAAVIFVHGAGYLQNAHHWWSSYFREYMFHNLLTDLGYTVLDIDYRASKGYGRDHRTAIYRHMGGKDLTDQVDGLNWLVENQGIDQNRVGIYGGSYGGFITLMGLLTAPNTFACGGALRSVTDWSHYNHGYTANILNTPEEDSIAYQRSSPIYFAKGLNDPLIMFHGIKDDNVHFQDVVRLSQRFIELGKTDWELVPYPIERHGFTTASSWTHEYTRLLQLFNTHLLQNNEK